MKQVSGIVTPVAVLHAAFVAFTAGAESYGQDKTWQRLVSMEDSLHQYVMLRYSGRCLEPAVHLDLSLYR